MKDFQIVVLWSDVLVWLLLVAGLGLAVLIARSPPLLAAWRRVGSNRIGMAAAVVLLAFIAVGLLDSLHYRPALESRPGEERQYAVEVLSLLDLLATPLRTEIEKTYSAPFATRLYVMETLEAPGLGTVREYPRLKYGGSHLGEREDAVFADAGLTALRVGALAMLGWLALAGAVALAVGGWRLAVGGWRTGGLADWRTGGLADWRTGGVSGAARRPLPGTRCWRCWRRSCWWSCRCSRWPASTTSSAPTRLDRTCSTRF